jgi:hypothetical protein
MKMRILSILFLAVVVLAGASRAGAQTPAPMIFFTDLTGGPNSGGESVSGYAGAYVTIYGNNFGASQGTSTVSWNGQNCLRVLPATGSYTGWGMSYLWYQKIVVQLGSSCTAGAGNFVVTVNGVASTSPSMTVGGTTFNGSQFTVRSGNIYCIATTGSDSNTGKFPSCWASATHSGATMASGDITYVENGYSLTSNDAYLAAFSIIYGPFNPAVGLVAYPGATVTLGANGVGNQYGIRNPAIAGTFTGWTVAGMSLRGGSCTELAANNYRIVGNDMTCDGATGYAGNLLSSVTNWYIYGNNIHNIGASCQSNGNSCKLYHAVYFGDYSDSIDFGWNIVDPDPSHTGVAGCRGVQWHVTASTTLNEYDIHFHDNIIRNSICDGLNLATVNPGLGTVEVFNNVFYHNGTGPDPSGQESGYSCLYTNSQITPTVPVLVYNNSFYDCGSRGNSDESNGAFSITIPTKLTNNAVYSTSSSTEPYFSLISGACSLTSGSNNDWYGAGAPPCGANITGSLNVDPQFTSATSGATLNDLHPLSGSPLIDAGLTMPTLTYDHDGVGRPQGSAYDIGAYEYFTGGSTVQKPNPPTNLVVTVQ